MELRVHKVVQFASGGSHYTVYEAEVEFVHDGSGVQVLGTEPRNTVPGDYQLAVESIRKGAEQVLAPLGVSATIRLARIVLHPVDFNPRKFEQYTVEELRRLVEQWQAEQGAPADVGRDSGSS